MRFTDLALRKLPFPEKGQKRYWDQLTPAFGLSASQKSKSFIVIHGNPRKFQVIGKHGTISLADARKKARTILASKTDQDRSTAFTDARTAYLEECKERIRPATIRQYTRCLGYLKFRGDVQDITRADLTPHLKHPHAAITFKTFFNWCIRNDLVDRNPLIGERIPQGGARTRVLTPEEIKLVWHYDDKPFSDILKLLILTGQRRSEITAIQPEWIADVISFPDTITKNKRKHSIPYGPLTKKYLKPMSFNGWSKSKKRLDGVVTIPHWTIHDLRRTFATFHAELGTPVHVTEKLLNHVSGTHSGIVGVYQQHAFTEEMKQAVSTYEDYISKLVGV